MTICGCYDGLVTCELPDQAEMIASRSKCSLRSNWYITKIQKMTMNRDSKKEGTVVIRNHVGIDGFKIIKTEILR